MNTINEKKVKKKIRSYLDQDKKNIGAEFISRDKSKKYIPENYIDINDVKILLEIQNNKCYICNDLLNLNWESGCKYQLSLDRINGNNPHLKGNILLACWYCNCRGYNNKRCCKKKCCNDKSIDIREKKNIPDKEILKLLTIYNKKVKGNYTPHDDWKDYEGYQVESNKYDSDIGENVITFKTNKAAQDWLEIERQKYGNMMELYHPGYKNMSRRQRKNILPPNTEFGFCDENDRCSGCGRRDLSCRCGIGSPWY